MQESITIQKHPELAEGSDYELLRRKGMEYIQQLGSAFWTDYNIHDPGITLLELLAYAITDLGFRSSFDIKDLLAEPLHVVPRPERQAFFTAREILTVNPWTNRDYRKLLVDVEGIKNAWLHCKECPCDDMYLYANCAKSELQYETSEHEIILKGLYDVLIEFEDEEGIGDLNSGKIKYNFGFMSGTEFTNAAIEIRLPSWHQLEENKALYQIFRNPNSEVRTVAVQFISGNKTDNVDVPADELGNVLRGKAFVTLEVEFAPDKDLPSTELLTFSDVPMHVWFKSDADRKAVLLPDLKDALEDNTLGGILAKYLTKIKKADEAIAKAKFALHEHRNLSEDYCSIKGIEVEDIAVCADMEVDPTADIEKVLAETYYLIDQYFSPDIKFYSLQQLLNAGTTVDDIFEGPPLNNGFIDNEQIDSTNLKKVIYTSDIINLLMDIPGVKAIKNFMLARYDDEGTLIESQPWSMAITYQHQPRLYVEASKFLVFKGGLPFLPDKLELADTLQVIKGLHVQPKFSVLELDLPVPKGEYYSLNDYYPLHYSLPVTYGVSPEGLPGTASVERKAQAKQLKAYLLFYEQLLVNYLEQLSHVKDLFALDKSVSHSYFSKLLKNQDIKNIETELYGGLNEVVLKKLSETEDVFLDRRNRFLDHLMARFAEQFNEYALLLHSFSTNKAVTEAQLIKDKIDFIKEYPFLSANRGRAINYKEENPCNSDNIAGLQRRIQLLLGMHDLLDYLQFFDERDINGNFVTRRWKWTDESGKIYLLSTEEFPDEPMYLSEEKVQGDWLQVQKWATEAPHYHLVEANGKWQVQLWDSTPKMLGSAPQTFDTQADAEASRDASIAFAQKIVVSNRLFVVEHLLLRPRNKPSAAFPEGDPLLSICIAPDCSLCGDEDPYSFRLTVILNGEEGAGNYSLANKHIEFRRFAEQTIRMEVPAHLGVKICWVSSKQLLEFETTYCAWLSELSKPEPDASILHAKLTALLELFVNLKSVYPQAKLHDCEDGDDENRVYLNQTII